MKTLKISLLAMVSTVFMTSCDSAPKKSAEETTPTETQKETPAPVVKAYDISALGDATISGKVTFTEENGKVTLTVDAKGITPGEHGIHLHETADCSSPDGMSTGGHWNPTGHDHGQWEAESFHMGDIGNLVANEEGIATLTFTTDKWCIGCEDANKNIIGRGLIIHADADDFHTQPTGNAGGRIGCVEIK